MVACTPRRPQPSSSGRTRSSGSRPSSSPGRSPHRCCSTRPPANRACPAAARRAASIAAGARPRGAVA
eukprot:614551-Lingulodinium_polyedra.AAC.1